MWYVTLFQVRHSLFTLITTCTVWYVTLFQVRHSLFRLFNSFYGVVHHSLPGPTLPLYTLNSFHNVVRHSLPGPALPLYTDNYLYSLVRHSLTAPRSVFTVLILLAQVTVLTSCFTVVCRVPLLQFCASAVRMMAGFRSTRTSGKDCLSTRNQDSLSLSLSVCQYCLCLSVCLSILPLSICLSLFVSVSACLCLSLKKQR